MTCSECVKSFSCLRILTSLSFSIRTHQVEHRCVMKHGWREVHRSFNAMLKPLGTCSSWTSCASSVAALITFWLQQRVNLQVERHSVTRCDLFPAFLMSSSAPHLNAAPPFLSELFINVGFVRIYKRPNSAASSWLKPDQVQNTKIWYLYKYFTYNTAVNLV